MVIFSSALCKWIARSKKRRAPASSRSLMLAPIFGRWWQISYWCEQTEVVVESYGRRLARSAKRPCVSKNESLFCQQGRDIPISTRLSDLNDGLVSTFNVALHQPTSKIRGDRHRVGAAIGIKSE